MRSYAIFVTLVLALALAAGPATASNAIAKQEGVACTTCHDKPGSRLLTDRGKYYELMGEFDGFDAIRASFGQCTSCHVRKPGSLKLTKQGRSIYSVMHDMEGLRAWVTANHPTTPPESAPDEGEAESGEPAGSD